MSDLCHPQGCPAAECAADADRAGGEHPPYVTVYHSVGGWRAVLMAWVEYPDDFGWYEPWNSWFGQPSREAAVRDARSWAEAEGIACRV